MPRSRWEGDECCAEVEVFLRKVEGCREVFWHKAYSKWSRHCEDLNTGKELGEDVEMY